LAILYAKLLALAQQRQALEQAGLEVDLHLVVPRTAEVTPLILDELESVMHDELESVEHKLGGHFSAPDLHTSLATKAVSVPNSCFPMSRVLNA